MFGSCLCVSRLLGNYVFLATCVDINAWKVVHGLGCLRLLGNYVLLAACVDMFGSCLCVSRLLGNCVFLATRVDIMLGRLCMAWVACDCLATMFCLQHVAIMFGSLRMSCLCGSCLPGNLATCVDIMIERLLMACLRALRLLGRTMVCMQHVLLSCLERCACLACMCCFLGNYAFLATCADIMFGRLVRGLLARIMIPSEKNACNMLLSFLEGCTWPACMPCDALHVSLMRGKRSIVMCCSCN